MKKTISAFVLILTLLCLCLPVGAEASLPKIGDTVEGFIVTEVSRFDTIGADLVYFVHEKTGAELLYIANDDINRVFEITFKTPALDDTGIPHVFEHSTLDGSEKYPSASLFFNLSYQTYNTYMNASTYNFMTTYPVASLSEAQLLALADYYTDSCLNPTLMHDESIYREEAWRYSLNNPEDPLTISGTVYSEMQGAMDISSTAYLNFMKAVAPGSTRSNESGGLPSEIPDMTYQSLCDYHDAYYHPSNSLTCLYGSFEDYTAFLKLLDSYFSQYERQDISITDSGYEPITEAVEYSMVFPVESGYAVGNDSIVYYGIVCDTEDLEDINKLDLLTTLLNDSSSAMQQTMKERFPSGTFQCYIDFTTPEPVLAFCLDGVEQDQAPAFRDTVNELLAQTAETGFDADSVSAIESSVLMSTLLLSENSDLGVSIIPNFACYWALFDDIHGYQDSVDALFRFTEYNETGAFSEIIRRLAINNPRTVLITTVPVPGVKEEEDAALASRLAEIKAGMTAEEINAIIEQTAALANPEEEDTSAYVAQLQAVTVQNLPEEIRFYDITDTTENGIRYITAEANTDGVGTAILMLDAAGLSMEQLQTFKLFTALMGELDTSQHTRAQLSSLTTRYLYDGTIWASIMESPDEDGLHPYLRLTFTAMDEDLEAGYDVLYELLYDSDVTDVQRLKDTLSALVNNLKKQITSEVYLVNLYRGYSLTSPSAAAYSYISYLDYYQYLLDVQERLETDPQSVVADLQAIQQYFQNSNGAIVAYAGSMESAAKNRDAADAFLAKLSSRPVAETVYSFPAPASSEAIIIDSSVQYNLVFAGYETLGLDSYDGALDAVTTLVTDAYLMPMLRDQYGVYSVFHFAADYGIAIETYRDSNIAETFRVYETLPDVIRSMDITQDELNNYILSSYSGYAKGQGELTGASSAILNLINFHPQEEKLARMHSLKSLTPESFREYANLYAALMENGMRVTAGGAAAIYSCSDFYVSILDPFGASEITLPQDLLDDSVYAAAAMFCRENGLMYPLSDELFGVNEDATLGDLAVAMYVAIGGNDNVEEAVAALSGYGILDGTAEEPLTREALACYGFNFLTALGVPVEESTPQGFEDISEADSAAVGAMGFLLENGLMLPADGNALAPKAPATRGEIALFMQLLFS